MDHGSRNYEVAGYRLPSVTTILGGPKMIRFLKIGLRRKVRKKRSVLRMLQLYVARVCISISRIMYWQGHEDLTELGQRPNVAQKVIEVGLAPVSEYFSGHIYYPGLYAGSTDLVGIHNGKETVIDFKQANAPKKNGLEITNYKLAHTLARPFMALTLNNV